MIILRMQMRSSSDHLSFWPGGDDNTLTGPFVHPRPNYLNTWFFFDRARIYPLVRGHYRRHRGPTIVCLIIALFRGLCDPGPRSKGSIVKVQKGRRTAQRHLKEDATTTTAHRQPFLFPYANQNRPFLCSSASSPRVPSPSIYLG